MSFSISLIAGDGPDPRLPRKSDLLRILTGYVVRDEPPIARSVLANLPAYMPMPGDDTAFPMTDLIVGTPTDGECRIGYTWGPDPDPVQTMISVDRPLAATWLWEAVFGLLAEFDLYLVYPSLTGVIVAHDVAVPEALVNEYGVVEATSSTELIRTITGEPRTRGAIPGSPVIR